MSDQPRHRPPSDSIPVHPDGVMTVGDQLKELKRWTRDHDEKDDSRHEGIMKEITSFKVSWGKLLGIAIACGAFASLMGVVSAAASVYAVLAK